MQTASLHLFSRLSLLTLAAFVLFSGQATAQNADAVARQLAERYADVDALAADFTQTVGSQKVQGSLEVRGSSFRLNLPGQTLVTDGTTLWSYSSDEEQVVIQDYEPGDVGFQTGQLFTDYLAVFRPTGASRATIGGVQHDVLALRPREAGASVRDVTLYARSSDGVPTRIRVHDVNGTTLAFDLRNVRLNPRLAADRFRFTAPRGTEVVDLRG